MSTVQVPSAKKELRQNTKRLARCWTVTLHQPCAAFSDPLLDLPQVLRPGPGRTRWRVAVSEPCKPSRRRCRVCGAVGNYLAK